MNAAAHNSAIECLDRRSDPIDYAGHLSERSAKELADMRLALIIADHRAMIRRFTGAPVTQFGEFA